MRGMAQLKYGLFWKCKLDEDIHFPFNAHAKMRGRVDRIRQAAREKAYGLPPERHAPVLADTGCVEPDVLLALLQGHHHTAI